MLTFLKFDPSQKCGLVGNGIEIYFPFLLILVRPCFWDGSQRQITIINKDKSR